MSHNLIRAHSPPKNGGFVSQNRGFWENPSWPRVFRGPQAESDEPHGVRTRPAPKLESSFGVNCASVGYSSTFFLSILHAPTLTQNNTDNTDNYLECLSDFLGDYALDKRDSTPPSGLARLPRHCRTGVPPVFRLVERCVSPVHPDFASGLPFSVTVERAHSTTEFPRAKARELCVHYNVAALVPEFKSLTEEQVNTINELYAITFTKEYRIPVGSQTFSFTASGPATKNPIDECRGDLVIVNAKHIYRVFDRSIDVGACSVRITHASLAKTTTKGDPTGVELTFQTGSDSEQIVQLGDLTKTVLVKTDSTPCA